MTMTTTKTTILSGGWHEMVMSMRVNALMAKQNGVWHNGIYAYIEVYMLVHVGTCASAATPYRHPK